MKRNFLKWFTLAAAVTAVFGIASCSDDNDDNDNRKNIVTNNIGGGNNGNLPADAVAVDLGLSSGTKWANMNVGAEKPEDYGLFFAWGETVGYTIYTSDGRSFDWASYKWFNGSLSYTMTRYCTNSNYGKVDDKTTLDLKDDAASANWGGQWRMPTIDEVQELQNSTTSYWTTVNGVYGRVFTSNKNGNYIFLPAAGLRWDGVFRGSGSFSFYWSSTLDESYPYCAYYLYFDSGDAYCSNISRSYGLMVRPVQLDPTGNAPEGAVAVDLGLPSGTKWANMNVGAEKPEDYGLYFAWGETVGYTSNTNDGHDFDWTSYKWCNGSSETMTKYCTDGSYGTADDKTVLELKDDAARANWGGQWVMPTLEEIAELFNNTTNEWTTVNGVNGRKFTSKANDNYIFLPAAGHRDGSSLLYQTQSGYYWSSTVYPSNSDCARGLYFGSWNVDTDINIYRSIGQSVRPILRN